ncbi:hypothetical protein HCG51_17400 [Tolypothrix sp. PCC 7910]|nr:hypothetical protein [Tolypothrix sp. PCC 7910]QIR38304.1 hypothetical protein HCG51_17400 [Tolypothrix sp. PCC 7910]
MLQKITYKFWDGTCWGMGIGDWGLGIGDEEARGKSQLPITHYQLPNTK